MFPMNAQGISITGRQSARERFESNLPQRKVLLSLPEHDPESTKQLLREVVFSPLAYFGLLGIVSPSDCSYLFEQQNHFKLWEEISLLYEYDAGAVAKKAKEALGEENLRALATSLVNLDNIERVTGHETTVRALSGINLASALPLNQVAGVVARYSNMARVEKSTFDDMMISFLRAGVHTFSRSFYEESPASDGVQKLNIETIARTIISDLRTFADKKIHVWTSHDEVNKNGIAGQLAIARDKVIEDGFNPELTKDMDALMRKLGYRFIIAPGVSYYSNKGDGQIGFVPK